MKRGLTKGPRIINYKQLNAGEYIRFFKSLLFSKSILVLLFFSFVHAIPRFAMENGSSCILCHVDPTGTGLRNDYGISIVSQNDLPARPEKGFPNYKGILLNHFQVGGDVRIQSVTISKEGIPRELTLFPMQATFQIASIGEFYTLMVSTEFHQLYPGSNRAKLSDVFAYQLQLKNLLPNIYIKMGKARPSYGLLLEDHTAFIRGGNLRLKKSNNLEGLPFTPFLKTTNIFEIGAYLGDIFMAVSGADGYISSSGTTFTGRIEYYGEIGKLQGLAGASYLQENSLILKGLFGGLNWGTLSWMGEVDLAYNLFLGTSLASYSELAWNGVQGWTLLCKIDFFDEDIEFTMDSIRRFTLGINYVPFPFVEIKIQARYSQVSSLLEQSGPEFLLQLHTWF